MSPDTTADTGCADAGPPTPADRGLPGWPAALTKPLAAAYVGMSERWIEQQVSAGGFPRPVKLGRASRWLRTAVDAWLAALDGGARG